MTEWNNQGKEESEMTSEERRLRPDGLCDFDFHS